MQCCSAREQCPAHQPVKYGLGLDLACAAAGVPPAIENTPLTEVLLVNIKLLTLSELRLITDKGTEGRRQLSDAFSGPNRLTSSLHRAAVV